MENGKYYFKTIGCDKNSKAIKKDLSTTFSESAEATYNEFLHTLKPGQYQYGMSSRNLDFPITNEAEKSDLYKLVEKKLAERKLTIPTTLFGHSTFYTLNSNKKYSYKELNQIPISKIKDIQIMGTEGYMQVILLEK
ncbi:hypothetical protein K5I29_05055 [Flavobacterium agricola]|uniref:Uncharacterized protein n=1 Tax=Flavobacterium agricola TaxID=2870839 RepID=A0ABY6M4H3_9FLAO|nr:hypothetical protein [Flavobacterium agricola]UYW02271.1 hypothetical protein K5I29_05055 [Flavobacterium agricola]